MLEIRPARPEDYPALGELTASTYLIEACCDEAYAEATVLVAHDDGQLVGGGSFSQGQPPGTAVIQALVTAPRAEGAGVGTALIQACLDRARQDGCDRIRLSTRADSPGLYERHGFRRTPDEDWQPAPEIHLVTYALTLRWCGLCGEPGTHAGCELKLALEPPRYCTQCKRRMVVQVHPTGWSARCVEHGTIHAA